MRAISRTMAGMAGILVAGMAATATAPVQAEELSIIGHAVHQRVTTGEAGGDFAGAWADENGVEINWLTFNVQDVHERLYREASLGSTTIDVGFVANRYFRPQYPQMFEPLDDYIASAPIEDFDELPQGMLDALTYDGKLYGIPFRHATAALHINTKLFEERGVALPETFEDVIAAARELTFRRDDGTQVHGLLLDFRSPAVIIDIPRAMGNGDFLTADFQLKADSPAMVEGVQLIADLFEEGVIPEAFLNFTTEDVITYMQQERAAMAISPFGRYRNFNDAEQSSAAGRVISVPLPASADLEGYDVAPVRTEFWAMVIPKNSDNKDGAWAFIRNASSPENTIKAAVNGNGPVRPSAYSDQRVIDLVPYAESEQAALSVARPGLPGFDEAARVEDIFIEEIDQVFLGLKTAEEAMSSVQSRVEPLLP